MAIKPIAIGTSTGGNSDVSVEDSNGSLVFRPNGTEQMRIDTTGALTLGSALAVAEGGTGVTALSSLDAADLGSGSATDGYVLTADGAGGAAWEAKAPIDLLSSGASIRKSDGTTAVLSESGGAVTLENVANAYLSGGVYLGGTGSANYLDDYEEGTATLLWDNSVSAGTAYYTKVGRQVTINVSTTTNANIGGLSGGAILYGLPFISAGSRASGSVLYRRKNNPTGGLDLVPYVTNASTQIELWWAGNDYYSRLQYSQFDDAAANNDLAITITYFTS